jgi:hypothetical protein
MKYKLIMAKERYDAVQEKMSDKVFFTKDEIEDDGTHWVHFEVEIEGTFDLLDFFHAGYHAGYNHRSKAFQF